MTNLFYEDVFRKLNKERVRYVVAGGVAVVLHGVMRFTGDLDLIIDMELGNIEKFFTALNELGYRPKVPITKEEFKIREKRREWIKKKGMKVFSFFHLKDHLKLIDVFVDETVNYDKIKKEYRKVRDIKIPVVDISGLKKLKRKAGRPVDFADISSLEEIEEIKRIMRNENKTRRV